MISIYNLKPKFQNLLRPLTQILYQQGITANMVTLFAMFSSILVGLLLYTFSKNPRIYFILPFFCFSEWH